MNHRSQSGRFLGDRKAVDVQDTGDAYPEEA
jgi:hypothetical protein